MWSKPVNQCSIDQPLCDVFVVNNIVVHQIEFVCDWRSRHACNKVALFKHMVYVKEVASSITVKVAKRFWQ